MHTDIFAAQAHVGDELFVPGPNHLEGRGSLDSGEAGRYCSYQAIVTGIALDPANADNLALTLSYGPRGTYTVKVRTDAYLRRRGVGRRVREIWPNCRG